MLTIVVHSYLKNRFPGQGTRVIRPHRIFGQRKHCQNAGWRGCDRNNEHNWKGTQKPDTIDDRAHFHSNDLKFCCATGHSLTSASRREDGTQLRIDHVALSYLWDCSSCPFPVPCVVESIADCAQYGWLLWPVQDNNTGIWPKVRDWRDLGQRYARQTKKGRPHRIYVLWTSVHYLSGSEMEVACPICVLFFFI